MPVTDLSFCHFLSFFLSLVALLSTWSSSTSALGSGEAARPGGACDPGLVHRGRAPSWPEKLVPRWVLKPRLESAGVRQL